MKATIPPESDDESSSRTVEAVYALQKYIHLYPRLAAFLVLTGTGLIKIAIIAAEAAPDSKGWINVFSEFAWGHHEISNFSSTLLWACAVYVVFRFISSLLGDIGEHMSKVEKNVLERAKNEWRERYEPKLTTVPGVHIYRLKSFHAATEGEKFICPHCYDGGNETRLFHQEMNGGVGFMCKAHSQRFVVTGLCI